MSEFKPDAAFTTAMYVYPVTTETTKGSTKKVLSDPFMIYVDCASFGGTEVTKNDLLMVEDTWQITTWYHPDITADCIVAFADNTDVQYEILGTPEDIRRRHQYMKFKIRRRGGIA